MKFDTLQCKLVQRALNELCGLRLSADGKIGPASFKAIQDYRQANGIPGDGLDTPLWDALLPHISRRFVQISDIVRAAREAGIPPSMALAVWDKESRGSGFLPDGRCTILYERHIFYKEAVKVHGRTQAERWAKSNPNVCHPVWDAKAYSGGAGEYNRLDEARMLDARIALLSASWGLFQMMGFNYGYTRFRDVQEMVVAYNETEHEHLAGFIGFIEGQPALLKAMQTGDYHGVGRIYNGRSYASHGYHIDLEKRRNKYLAYDNL